MVANHAHKKLARQLMDQLESFSYTQAMAMALRLDQIRTNKEWRLHRDPAIAEQAGAILRSGRDLIIFGAIGSGRSTASYTAIEASGLRSLLLEGDALSAAYAAANLDGLPAIVAHRESTAIPKEIGVELVAVDELRYSNEILEAQLSTAAHRLIVIHAQSPEQAMRRIGYYLPELELRDPAFLQAILGDQRDGNGKRRRALRLHP